MSTPALSRRSLLGAGVGAAALVGAPVAARAAAVPVRRQRRRAVVIGSGFGGAVAALRLTRAGVPVTLLEQGRAWPTGPNSDTFPTVETLDERLLFYGSAPELFGRRLSLAPYAGLLNSVAGPTMTVLSGVGYGGGSLTYQGMTLQPSRAVFESEFPGGLDYDEMTEHYGRVRRMLRLETAPDSIVSAAPYEPARIFRRNARAAGYPVDRVPMPIDWTFAERELRGEMTPSYTNGNCAFGVNNGGKHSLDVTYLRAAEATGRLDVRLLHRVTDVERTGSGEWRVTVVRTDVRGNARETVVITTPTLVMGAGSAGTTRMLVRAAANGAVPDLPDGLGRNWGSNADRIYVWTNPEFPRVQGGPVVFSSREWDDPARANTVIQASIPPVAFGGVDVDPRSTIMVGYGVSAARGRWLHDPVTDAARLLWAPENDAAIQTSRIGPRVAEIAGPGSVLLDTNLVAPSTWHPLGGAGMGDVCDLEGRVRGQRGLYVLDGALLPGTAGACNPSMTIAAVAERAMSRIVRRDVADALI
ncbi:GMC oxidoreductase [Nocardioides sp. CFH 31398]|uniref:GMC oxidoreductase n=1 Tax=Nocardioides sp. CFH 31398 TaxID=2919579 RepID=UPI001F05D4BE|nr:GMC oxidoreductase [Nocardioides sp. CFH 31398]MCH1866711.1 GMC oxidoreductase [Nocardioides sp. CFH 31398]